MRIYTKSGDLAFSTFTFPDGQPHFKLETFEHDFSRVTIETSIKSPLELFQLGLAVDVLRNNGFSEVNLDIRYFLGARMDRAIDSLQPNTLQSVAKYINSLGLSKVRILDVHSDVALRLIRNSENVLPLNVVEQVIAQFPHCTIAIPDKGAVDRVMKVTRGPSGYIRDVVYCSKVRDMATGKLSGFSVDRGPGRPFSALIIDDICDGGGTFVGLAKELRKAGAKTVNLFVTHGIFSKGPELEGIDKMFTTDSYWEKGSRSSASGHLVVIPISMKEL